MRLHSPNASFDSRGNAWASVHFRPSCVAWPLIRLLFLCGPIFCTAAVNEPCKITTAINPPSATADHSAAPPGNQVQFSLFSSVEGNCPMIPDIRGEWSTSDLENTTIISQSSGQALAVCLHETPQPVSIRYSGRIRGHEFPPATLVCR